MMFSNPRWWLVAGKDIFQENIDDAEMGCDEISVSDLFSAQLPQNGAHVTIITCDSGTQDIAPGDEPLGIMHRSETRPLASGPCSAARVVIVL